MGTRESPFRLSEHLAQTPPHDGKITLSVPHKKLMNIPQEPSSRWRDAILEVKSTQVTLTPSRKLSQVIKEQVTLSVVEAKEINPPVGAESVHWILFTTISVNGYEEALEILKFYSMRWRIEEYFRVLKSGCTVEKCCLSEGARLRKYLNLFSVIAWRIFWLKTIRRIAPEASCELVLTKDEWHCLYLRKNKNSPIPPKPPPIADAIVWIASLGGFLARKNDREPGMISLWRGWSRLQDLVHGRSLPSEQCFLCELEDGVF